MSNIQHVTDYASKGILLFINKLIQNLNQYDRKSTVELNNWNDVDLFKRSTISHFHFSNSTRRTLISIPFFRARKKVVTLHDIKPRCKWVPKTFIKIIYLYLNIFADRFIVHSAYAKAMFMDIASFIPSEKISIIPLGCEIWDDNNNSHNLRTHYGLNDADLIFSMVGSIKDPGQLEAIRIFSELDLPNAKLIIIGGTSNKKHRKFIEDHLRNNMMYLGFVDDNILLDHIKLSDFLISYRLESVGESSGPMLQAIGSGTPIICSNVGSFPEVVGEAGIIVRNANELRNTLKELHNSPSIKREIAECVNIQRLKYNWKNIAKSHHLLYNSLLEDKP